MLTLRSVRAALSLSRYSHEVLGYVPDRVELDNERVINAMVAEKMVEGVIDRVAVLYKNDRPYAAEIFDYKVDAFDPKMTLLWLDDRVEHHRPQMELYAQVVAQQLQIPRQQVATHLLMLSTDDLVRLDRPSVAAPRMLATWPPTQRQPTIRQSSQEGSES